MSGFNLSAWALRNRPLILFFMIITVIAGHDWELDGETIVVTIPMTWKRRGGRKVIIVPTAATRGRRPTRASTRC